jgi:hypothetical protein
VEREIVSHAEARSQTLEDGHDLVGHYLAKALRVPAPPMSTGATTAHSEDLDCLREAWLHIAALEHIAVSALDRKLSTPTYQPCYETLQAAIVETAANLLCRARLIARPGAFRHEQAWRAQSTALSHAQEMYINGLPGASDERQRAQTTTLTRLVRAAVAIMTIDLSRAADANGNRHPAQ